MTKVKQIEEFLRKEPTRRYHTGALYIKFGKNKDTAEALKYIREGKVPDLHWSKCKTPKGTGLRYEYFYVPEGFFLDPKVVTFRELLETGYLQEANRQFFHPLGLGLALVGDPQALIVYDFRDKPYAATFSPAVTTSDKFLERAENIAYETAARLLARQEVLGYGVQSVSNRRPKTKVPNSLRQHR